MRESHLLQHIYTKTAGLEGANAHVAVGPGDDCAVLDMHGFALLASTDQLIAHRHFDPAVDRHRVAYKAVARALSDIAAMAGSPLATLAAVALPPDMNDAEELFDAVHHAADRLGSPLVGGDVASTTARGPLALTVTVLGATHPTRGPVLRSGAKPGDVLFVTGALGGAWRADLGEHARAYHFTPRVALATALADALDGRLTAMIDISDGLGADAARIAHASRVRIDIDSGSIPVHKDAERDVRSALADGEDYELAFTAAPTADLETTLSDVSRRLRTPITRVGAVRRGAGCSVRFSDGRTVDAAALGWEHT